MAVSALLAPLLGLLLLSAPLVPAFSASQPVPALTESRCPEPESGSEAGFCRLHQESGIVILVSFPLHGAGRVAKQRRTTW